MKTLVGLRAVVVLAGLASGCSSWLPAPVPMKTASSKVQPDRNARCLLVFLPGFGDSEKDFADHGFVDALRLRKLSVDVISTDATFGYYARRTVIDRVELDVLRPARAAGYEQIWMMGISMGGIGTLLVTKREKEQGREITGNILIAPYLGDKHLQKEIHEAGGLQRWQSGPKLPDESYDRDIWRFLQGITQHSDASPILYLGAGDEDRLSYGHRVLAAALPESHVFATEGGHDWGPWSILWNDILDQSELKTRCAPR